MIIALPKATRQKTARLINVVDEYNSVIETADPGQRALARLTERLRKHLAEVIGLGDEIGEGLLNVLANEP